MTLIVTPASVAFNSMSAVPDDLVVDVDCPTTVSDCPRCANNQHSYLSYLSRAVAQ